MANTHVLTRIGGIRQQLMGAYEAGSTLSSASKGSEREIFIDGFLSQVLPQMFRFGTGNAVDINGNRSGQLDIVVEYPFLPSLPLPGAQKNRLYLAESIAAVIEVKSSVSAQWDDVLNTAKQLHVLERDLTVTTSDISGGRHLRTAYGSVTSGFSGSVSITKDGISAGGKNINFSKKIPLFAVGYKGWAKPQSLNNHLQSGEVDGILVLDGDCIFKTTSRFGNIELSGNAALWGFICALDSATKEIAKNFFDPIKYGI